MTISWIMEMIFANTNFPKRNMSGGMGEQSNFFNIAFLFSSKRLPPIPATEK